MRHRRHGFSSLHSPMSNSDRCVSLCLYVYPLNMVRPVALMRCASRVSEGYHLGNPFNHLRAIVTASESSQGELFSMVQTHVSSNQPDRLLLRFCPHESPEAHLAYAEALMETVFSVLDPY